MPIKTIAVAACKVQVFLLDPGNLAQWTVHRALFKQDGRWYEIRRAATADRPLTAVALQVSAQELPHQRTSIVFQWQAGNRVEFILQQLGPNSCELSAQLSSQLPPEKLQTMQKLLTIELGILQALMERDGARSRPQNIPAEHWIFMQEYHLNMYT